MVERRKARIAANEALRRAVNERVATWEERRVSPDERNLFFCECGHDTCYERLSLTIPEYESLRADPMRFGVAPHHVIPDAERVVEWHVYYFVVEKNEEVRGIVEPTNPRRGDAA
jgi:hypothetical protein